MFSYLWRKISMQLQRNQAAWISLKREQEKYTHIQHMTFRVTPHIYACFLVLVSERVFHFIRSTYNLALVIDYYKWKKKTEQKTLPEQTYTIVNDKINRTRNRQRQHLQRNVYTFVCISLKIWLLFSHISSTDRQTLYWKFSCTINVQNADHESKI